MRPVVTAVDHVRISSYISYQGNGPARKNPGIMTLRQRLEEAMVVDAETIAKDRITMNSQVVFRYLDNNEVRTLRLVYPSEMPKGSDSDAVSVMAPVGAALLGARKGDVVTWKAPAGEMRGEVLDVLYQPEAAGDPD